MALSVRERVLAAFEARLATVAAPNVPGRITVYRGRRKAVAESAMPALVMHAAVDGQDQASAGHVVNRERVTVTAYAKADTDAGLDRALADLTAALQAAIEGDPTLGGLAVDTSLVDSGQGTADDEGVGGDGEAFAVFAVEFWTRPGDPYTPAP